MPKTNQLYYPREDSYFLSEILKKAVKNYKFVSNLRVLDMGSGTGIQSRTITGIGVNSRNITLADINPIAVSYLTEKFPNSKVIKSDLFQNIIEKFDFIIFNPPYLPNSKYDNNLDTTGGKNGSEVINRFLSQAKNHLTKKGKVIFLSSSLTKKINFNNYRKKLLGKRRFFFEELYVWELER